MGPKDQVGDGLDLEFSDLRAGRPVDVSPARERAATFVAGSDVPSSEITSNSPRPVLPKRSHRGLLTSRRARGYAVACLVALACIGLSLTFPGTRQTLGQAFVHPTPTATVPLLPNGDAVYFVRGVPWGTLTVDGRPLTLAAVAPTRLPRGRHALEYRADPFPSVRCILSVPSVGGDDCPLTYAFTFKLTGGNGNMGAARVVDLGLVPARLPAGQLTMLERAVDAALLATSSTTRLEVGDHYLAASGQIAVAASPTLATLALSVNQDPSRSVMGASALPGTGICISLCATNGDGVGSDWLFDAHIVVASWRLATLAGQPIDTSPWTLGPDMLFTFAGSWQHGTWDVTPQPTMSEGFCDAAFSSPAMPSLISSSYAMRTVQAPVLADGCAMTIESGETRATPTPPSANAPIFLYRLGAVLAASDAAHNLAPQVPLASAHERALALQWLASAH